MKITSAFYANGATCVLYHTSPQYFISGLTPDDFEWNRWVSCSLHMAALMHSNYRKVGFLLQNKQTKKRVMQGTFTAPAWMTEPQKAVASLHLALPTELRMRHAVLMSAGNLVPFLAHRVSHPSPSTWREALVLMHSPKDFLVVGDFSRGSHTISSVQTTCYSNI